VLFLAYHASLSLDSNIPTPSSPPESSSWTSLGSPSETTWGQTDNPNKSDVELAQLTQLAADLDLDYDPRSFRTAALDSILPTPPATAAPRLIPSSRQTRTPARSAVSASISSESDISTTTPRSAAGSFQNPPALAGSRFTQPTEAPAHTPTAPERVQQPAHPHPHGHPSQVASSSADQRWYIVTRGLDVGVFQGWLVILIILPIWIFSSS
jgi:cell wall-associated NlpC family hydrolase